MLVTALLTLAAAQAEAPTSIAFVGDLGTPRAEAFATFLAERFEDVRVYERDGLDPAQPAKADVVLLDWDQDAGVMRWMRDRSVTVEHPLGEREAWRTPTVLLGSAGLNTAASWDVRGGSG